METTVEFIYTFEEKEQMCIELPLTETALQSADGMVALAVSALDEDEKAQLAKISTWVKVLPDEEIECPDWLAKCNGKFYFEDGKLV